MVEPKSLFKMDDLIVFSQGDGWFFVHTTDPELADIVFNMEGMSSVTWLGHDTLDCHTTPTYDAEEIWVELHDRLTDAVKLRSVWGSAIDEALAR